MTLKRLDSTDQAIEVLGGTKGVMALTGAKPTTVSWWRRNNRFPAKTYGVILDALRTAGYSADRSMWGLLTETEAAE